MSVTFSVSGQKQLAARLHAIGKAPEGMLRETAVRGVAEAKRLVPRQTGNLSRTIRIGTISNTLAEITAGGTREVGYAAAVEYGTKPHVIFPKRRKALAWGGARTLSGRSRTGSGPTNFAKRVNHPGTKPRPFLVPGFEKALRFIGLDQIVERWNQAA